MDIPLFSVVISCYNQSEVIADAVQSALSQTHMSREVIVVDDGSSDGSDAVLRAFGFSIRLVTLERNQGAPVARNAGAAAAQGEYLVYLDGDDLLKPWALSAYDQIIRIWKPSIILSSLSWFQGAIPMLEQADIPGQLKVVNYSNWIEKDRVFRSSASALVVKRPILEEIGGWKKEVWPFDDQYLAAELAYSGRAIQILDPPAVFYRLHSGNTIHNVPLLIAGSFNFVRSLESNRRFRGKRRTLASAALIGSPVFYAVRRAFKAGLLADGLRLFARAFPWIAAAALVRLRRVFIKRPIDSIPLQLSATRQSVDVRKLA